MRPRERAPTVFSTNSHGFEPRDPSVLIILLAGTVAFVALLTWWVGWALPLVIFAIIFIVMAHEFGHFITAKRAGMKVTDFFVGFGPVIWSTTIGETRYGVRAILAGGYVKVPGMTWTETIPEDEEKRTYRSASYPRKALFASAGSLMHVVMALLLAWAALTFVGLPSTSTSAWALSRNGRDTRRTPRNSPD